MNNVSFGLSCVLIGAILSAMTFFFAGVIAPVGPGAARMVCTQNGYQIVDEAIVPNMTSSLSKPEVSFMTPGGLLVMLVPVGMDTVCVTTFGPSK